MSTAAAPEVAGGSSRVPASLGRGRWLVPAVQSPTPVHDRGHRADAWLRTPGAAFLHDLSVAQARALLTARPGQVVAAALACEADRVLSARRVQGPLHAQVIEAWPECRQLRPKRHARSPIRHPEIVAADRRDRDGLPLLHWSSRDHFLAVIVPTALELHPDALAGRVRPELFLRWIRMETADADRRTGADACNPIRDVMAALGISERQVQNCRAIARTLGLMVDVFRGTRLSLEKRLEAYNAGSSQRGLTNVSVFAVPRDVHAHLEQQTAPARETHARRFARNRIGEFPHTPEKTRPARRELSPVKTTACGQKCGHLHPSCQGSVCSRSLVKLSSSKTAPRRGAATRQQAHRKFASELRSRVIWIRTDKRTSTARITHQLARFVDASPGWSVDQLIRAMNDVTRRLNFTTPTHTKHPAYGLLAWFLGQIDEVADHPHFGRAFEPHPF